VLTNKKVDDVIQWLFWVTYKITQETCLAGMYIIFRYIEGYKNNYIYICCVFM